MQAQSPHETELYARGAFLEAAASAEARASADDLAFAARALLACVITGEGAPDPALAARALRDAQGALALDPDHAEGALQTAIALSVRGRSLANAAALGEGLAGRTRRLAEQVLERHPDNHYAHAFLAVWNIEVRRRGGAIGAALLGASVEDARRRYEEARRLAPGDVGVHWQYARALSALDPSRYRAEALMALEAALSAPVRDRVEAILQERARELSLAYERTDREAQRLALSRL
jgi:hypothetical protein